jgi:hypothetical protein
LALRWLVLERLPQRSWWLLVRPSQLEPEQLLDPEKLLQQLELVLQLEWTWFGGLES